MDVDEYSHDYDARYPQFSDVADESMFLPDRLSCGLKRPAALPIAPPNQMAMRGTCDWRPKPNPWGNSPIASAIVPGSMENLCVRPGGSDALANDCAAKRVGKKWRRAGDAHRNFGSSEYFSGATPDLTAVFTFILLLIGLAFFIAYGVNEIRRDLAEIRRMLTGMNWRAVT